MKPDVEMVLGDTQPIVATLKDAAGAVVNLTGALVYFRLEDGVTEDREFAAQVLTPATAGRVQYALQQGDVAAPGTYGFRWRVVWGNGSQLTFPNGPQRLALRVND